MYKIIKWWKYRILNSKIGRKFGYSFVNKEVKNKSLFTADEINNIIINHVTNKKPIMVARFGSNEAFCCANVLGKRIGAISNHNSTNLLLMRDNAGFWPIDEYSISNYYDLMKDAYSNVDILGIWDQGMQDCLMDFWDNENIIKTEIKNLEPYVNILNPWSKALKGKKVLVIHPFVESINNQYKNREKIFPNTDVLPEFQLFTIKSPQTNALGSKENYKSWFDALEDIHNQTLNIDFDVAIIGCGAYGLPLASMIKRDGKCAIHLGSMVQILFGIRGRRWDIDKVHGYVRELINDDWKYPLESERPKGSKMVENGCYWK